ncbi:YfcE family phosphodiesterase [Staphylococcus caeli]|uniref:YfcE family phosphodiesterase n=1 Tax=Staphylococcus caeli TaxID=2201815 RepID=UPI003F545645
MTKWIIVSDNHTEQGVLFDVINHHEDIDVAIHLGDSEFAYDDSELSHYHRVKGNTDFYPEFPNEAVIEANGVKAFYTHGHLYNVNRTRMHLAEQAIESGCQFAFYGHTHVAKHEEINGVHVINPGSISQSRSNIEETYAELIVDETTKQVVLNFYSRDHHIIDSEKFGL